MTEGRLAPEEVRTRTFTRVVRGYKRRDVRRLLERAADDLDRLRTGPATEGPDDEPSLTAEAVEEARFQPALGGYEMGEVDDFLDQVVAELERATGEPHPPSALPAPPRSGLFPPRPFPEVRVTEARAPEAAPEVETAVGRAEEPAAATVVERADEPIAVPDADRAEPPLAGSQPPAAGPLPASKGRPGAGPLPAAQPPPVAPAPEPAPAASTPPDAPPEDPASTGWQQPAPSREPTPPEPTPPESAPAPAWAVDEGGFFPPPTVPPSAAPAPQPPPPPAAQPPAPPSTRPLTPSEVETRSFDRGAPGYLPAHVDLFMAKAARALAGRDGETLTRWDVLRQRFPLGPRGYATNEVDAFLVRLAAQFPDPEPAAQEEILRKLMEPGQSP
jgi:DivIVA domain-containing protein